MKCCLESLFNGDIRSQYNQFKKLKSKLRTDFELIKNLKVDLSAQSSVYRLELIHCTLKGVLRGDYDDAKICLFNLGINSENVSSIFQAYLRMDRIDCTFVQLKIFCQLIKIQLNGLQNHAMIPFDQHIECISQLALNSRHAHVRRKAFQYVNYVLLWGTRHRTDVSKIFLNACEVLLCNVPDIRIKSRGMFITSADSFRLDFLTWLHIYAKWILLNGALNNSLPLILKDPQLLHLLFENAIEDDASVVRLLSLLLLLSTEERWLSLTQISMTPSKILFELFTVLNCNNDVSVMADYLVSEDTIHVFGVDGGFLGVFIALLKALKWETAGSPEKALILTTLERLSTKIKIMHHHQLFPYDPTPLIRRIEHALSK